MSSPAMIELSGPKPMLVGLVAAELSIPANGCASKSASHGGNEHEPFVDIVYLVVGAFGAARARGNQTPQRFTS